MTIDTSKLTAQFMSGDASGLNVSKIVVYAMFEVGDEAGAPPPEPVRQGYSYAQFLRIVPPAPAVPLSGLLLLSGDMTDGDDAVLLSGDEQSGTDHIQYYEVP